jgi:hypothetical protein
MAQLLGFAWDVESGLLPEISEVLLVSVGFIGFVDSYTTSGSILVYGNPSTQTY